MPGSASSAHRPEGLIERLNSAAALTDGDEAKLKVLRELKNQIIGNRTKKLSYIKLGALSSVVSILSSASSSSDCLLIQSSVAIGSFACGLDAGVKAVLDAGAFPYLLNLISHSNEKVVDAGARALKMIYQSKEAPKYDFFEGKNMELLVSLLDRDNEYVSGLVSSIIAHSCETSVEQKALSDAGILKKLIDILGSTLSQRDAILEAFTAIIRENPEVISKVAGLENGRMLRTLVDFMKDRCPRTRFLACMCLITIENAAPSYLQSMVIRSKLILVLVELLDDPGQVGDEAAFALSSFITDEEGLQKLAFGANAVGKLCDYMQKEHLQAKRLQGIFMTMATLCSNLECCRFALLESPKALNIVIHALTHTIADVREAACICLKNVSRSVQCLSAGKLLDKAVIPLIQLLLDNSTSVQVAALCTISNIVVDFTKHKYKSMFIKSGAVEKLADLSKSMDSTVRRNALWALRNLAFRGDNKCKKGIFMELPPSTLTSLVSDPETDVQEQALALVRNLVDGSVDSIDYVFTEDRMLFTAIGRQLWLASTPDILVQVMYVFCNVATGKELHKEAVIHELLAKPPNNGTQPILVNMLQSSDNRIRTAAVWTIINLTFPTSSRALARVPRLVKAGITLQLRKMVDDPSNDVKIRVKTALTQLIPFGDFSSSS